MKIVLLLYWIVDLSRALQSTPTVGNAYLVRVSSSPYSFADVLTKGESVTNENTGTELVALAKGTELEKSAAEAAKKLSEFEAKRSEILKKIQAVRSRVRSIRIETAQILSQVTVLKATQGQPTQSIISDSESTIAALKADIADIEAQTISISQSQPARVAEAVRLAKTQLSLATQQTAAIQAELASIRQGDDETRLALAKSQAQSRIEKAEIRLKNTIDLPPQDEKISLAFAFVAGLLLADAFNLDSIDLYLAGAFSAIMFFLLPKD